VNRSDQISARTWLPLPPTETFDYSGFACELVADLREQAVRIRKQVGVTTASIIEIGNELLAAKRHLPHGQFEDWIEAECGFTVRTAQNYMRAAELAGRKSETVSLLPPNVLYLIAAKNTPPELVDDVIDSATAGKVINHQAVKAVLKDVANERRQRRKVIKRSARRSVVEQRRREAREKERLERVEREAKAADQLKQQLIDRFGIEGVRFLLDALARDKSWDVWPLLEEAVKQHDRDRVVDLVAAEQKIAP
jgi:hypothetical protein